MGHTVTRLSHSVCSAPLATEVEGWVCYLVWSNQRESPAFVCIFERKDLSPALEDIVCGVVLGLGLLEPLAILREASLSQTNTQIETVKRLEER